MRLTKKEASNVRNVYNLLQSFKFLFIKARSSRIKLCGKTVNKEALAYFFSFSSFYNINVTMVKIELLCSIYFKFEYNTTILSIKNNLLNIKIIVVLFRFC